VFDVRLHADEVVTQRRTPALSASPSVIAARIAWCCSARGSRDQDDRHHTPAGPPSGSAHRMQDEATARLYAIATWKLAEARSPLGRAGRTLETSQVGRQVLRLQPRVRAQARAARAPREGRTDPLRRGQRRGGADPRPGQGGVLHPRHGPAAGRVAGSSGAGVTPRPRSAAGTSLRRCGPFIDAVGLRAFASNPLHVPVLSVVNSGTGFGFQRKPVPLSERSGHRNEEMMALAIARSDVDADNGLPSP
jgi:hypothetical protein